MRQRALLPCRPIMKLDEIEAEEDPDRCSLCGRKKTGLVRCICPALEATGTCLRCGWSARAVARGPDAAMLASTRVVEHRKTAHAAGKGQSFRRGAPALPSAAAAATPTPLSYPSAAR